MFKRALVAGVLMSAAMAVQASPGPDKGGMLEQADANADGMIVKDEFLAARAAHFGQMDRNGDGFLTEADRPDGAEGHRAHRSGRMFKRIDADSDGKVSKDEFVNGGTRMFDRIDADHDSVLSAKELEAARDKGHRMRRHSRERRTSEE